MCIICKSKTNQESIEHIVPKSLGNTHYVLQKGIICRNCNNRFSRFESRVITSKEFYSEQVRLGMSHSDPNTSRFPLNNKDALRLTLKIGYEALFKSRKAIWEKMPHQTIRNFLLRGESLNEFIMEKSPEDFTFITIPGWLDRWRLKMNHTEILYGRANKGESCIKFRYGRILITAKVTEINRPLKANL